MFQPTTDCVDSLTIDDVTGQAVPESGTDRTAIQYLYLFTFDLYLHAVLYAFFAHFYNVTKLPTVQDRGYPCFALSRSVS